MKKLLFVLPLAALISCGENKTEGAVKVKGESTETKDAAPAKVEYALPIQYSSQFEMGDVKQAQRVIELWKMYDDNNFEPGREYFADSLQFTSAGGYNMKMTRDSTIATIKADRAKYSAVKTSVIAVMPVRSTDKGQDFVLAWAKEVHTEKGKTDSIRLHEVWFFDKSGKVSQIEQWAQQFPKK